MIVYINISIESQYTSPLTNTLIQPDFCNRVKESSDMFRNSFLT